MIFFFIYAQYFSFLFFPDSQLSSFFSNLFFILYFYMLRSSIFLNPFTTFEIYMALSIILHFFIFLILWGIYFWSSAFIMFLFPFVVSLPNFSFFNCFFFFRPFCYIFSVLLFLVFCSDEYYRASSSLVFRITVCFVFFSFFFYFCLFFL